MVATMPSRRAAATGPCPSCTARAASSASAGGTRTVRRSLPGSSRGLSIPNDWRTTDGPLFLVEGPSDVLALGVCGLSAIGRPLNMGGVVHLTELLRDFPPGRDVVVVGENDQKRRTATGPALPPSRSPESCGKGWGGLSCLHSHPARSRTAGRGSWNKTSRRICWMNGTLLGNSLPRP